MNKVRNQEAAAVQVTFFDDLMEVLQKNGKTSSKDIADAIEKLKKAKGTAEKRERKER